MDSGGYVKVHRKIVDSAVWHDEGLLKVFMWCIIRASYRVKGFKFYGEEEKLEVGQFITGRFSASEELHMHESRVYRALKHLEEWGMIRLKSDNKRTVITVCNYGAYQDPKTQREQQPNNNRTRSEQQSNTNKKERRKALKHTDKIKDIVDGQRFEDLWQQYPSKTGRKEAYRHFKATVKTPEDHAAIELALGNYLKSRRVADGYIQNGSTWFNNWRDWVEYKEPQNGRVGKEKRITPEDVARIALANTAADR